jgi:putative heme-binding domain-containing protein
MITLRGRSITRRVLLIAVIIVVAGGVMQPAAQNTSAGNPAIYEGKPAAGKAMFDAPGNCISCHRVGAAGAFYGPNLTTVGSRISPAGFRILLNTPSEKIRPENRLYEIALRSGKTVRGKLLNQDPYSVQMLDTDGKLVAYQRANIRSGQFTDPPQMPSYKDKLTSQQIADLVAYLTTLQTSE